MLFGVGKSAEIDDVLHARSFSSGRKIARAIKFDLCISMSRGHVVDQIVSGVHAIERAD